MFGGRGDCSFLSRPPKSSHARAFPSRSSTAHQPLSPLFLSLRHAPPATLSTRCTEIVLSSQRTVDSSFGTYRKSAVRVLRRRGWLVNRNRVAPPSCFVEVKLQTERTPLPDRGVRATGAMSEKLLVLCASVTNSCFAFVCAFLENCELSTV